MGFIGILWMSCSCLAFTKFHLLGQGFDLPTIAASHSEARGPAVEIPMRHVTSGNEFSPNEEHKQKQQDLENNF